eukprot:m.513777 g.513777  ORF g.513777 m.513777 type:complete len:84 (+) comp21907_c0_seq5:2159-2410(+)
MIPPRLMIQPLCITTPCVASRPDLLLNSVGDLGDDRCRPSNENEAPIPSREDAPCPVGEVAIFNGSIPELHQILNHSADITYY